MAKGNKGGGQSKYNGARHPAQVKQYLNCGMSIYEICRKFEIARQTFYDWMGSHEEFKAAVDLGIDWSRGWWEEQARLNLEGEGKSFNATLWMMNMRCRFHVADDVLPYLDGLDKAMKKAAKADFITDAMLSGKIGQEQANQALDAINKSVQTSLNEDGFSKRLKHVEKLLGVEDVANP